jgi:hypothetical protein
MSTGAKPAAGEGAADPGLAPQFQTRLAPQHARYQRLTASGQE